jgi:hypothetical protein
VPEAHWLLSLHASSSSSSDRQKPSRHSEGRGQLSFQHSSALVQATGLGGSGAWGAMGRIGGGGKGAGGGLGGGSAYWQVNWQNWGRLRAQSRRQEPLSHWWCPAQISAIFSLSVHL